MSGGRYGHNVQPLRLRTELVYPSFRGKISDFSLVYDQEVLPEAPVWIETYHAYAPGTGVMAPSDLAPVVDGRPVEALRDVGQHSHDDFDEVYFFYGTDHTDNTRLGGEVEMWLGHGDEAEKFVFSEPTAVYVPKGTAHNPWTITRITDADRPIMITTIALTRDYSLEPGRCTQYPYPPAFAAAKTGEPVPGTGKYAGLVNRLTLSRDIYITQLMGRACVPGLLFDDKVCRAPVWAEFFFVYAGGTGIGVPSLMAATSGDSMSYWDFRQGMQHTQAYDEVFLYIPTHPHDTLSLGGEAVEYLGDEGHSMTKASAVYVPSTVPHNPSYFKRVDRPYYLIVFAITNNWQFHEGAFHPTPAPDTFKF